MKWPWKKKRHQRWPSPADVPTLDDLARSASQIEESKRRLARTVAREGRVNDQAEALKREQKVNHLGPVIKKALHPKGTT